MKNKQLVFDYTNMLADAVGGSNGLSIEEVNEFRRHAEEFHRTLKADRETERIGFYNLPFHNRTVRRIKEYTKANYHKFDNFVVLGIGGSALGNIALMASLKHPYYNLLSSKERGGYPRVFVLDNIDPELMVNFLDVINPRKTLFNVISKSGSTAETAAQFLIFTDILRKKLGRKFTRNVVITTDYTLSLHDALPIYRKSVV